MMAFIYPLGHEGRCPNDMITILRRKRHKNFFFLHMSWKRHIKKKPIKRLP